jgi:hypothetical protein
MLLVERKWEIRGATTDLRARVKAAAKARMMGQSTWVLEALEAHLASAPTRADQQRVLDELAAIGLKLNQALARVQTLDQRIDAAVARAVAAALKSPPEGDLLATRTKRSRKP